MLTPGWARRGGARSVRSRFFFFNDTATTEIYTLSLHDALPISARPAGVRDPHADPVPRHHRPGRDRKSTRLNSSHVEISYAVFCLKKKKPLGTGRTITYLARAIELPILIVARLSVGTVNHTLLTIEAVRRRELRVVFFFNDTATTEIYTLSLHDALPI